MRIVSMLMVCALHVVGGSGILSSLPPNSAGSHVAWMIEIMCYGAVDCYALISGFVGIYAKYKVENIYKLWVQVVFYTLLFTTIFYFMFPGTIGKRELFYAITPIIHGQYWYFTAYFCLFVFMPFINKLLNSLSDRQLYLLCAVLILVTSFSPTFLRNDFLSVNGGYSAIWLISLYILGGTVRRSNILEKINGKTCIAVYLLCMFITFFAKVQLLNYVSPSILIGSIAMLIAFSKMNNISATAIKTIEAFAPLTFGVYLGQIHPLLIGQLHNILSYIPDANPLILFAKIIGSVFFFYLLLSAVEYIRTKIYKVLKINSYYLFVAKCIDGAVIKGIKTTSSNLNAAFVSTTIISLQNSYGD